MARLSLVAACLGCLISASPAFAGKKNSSIRVVVDGETVEVIRDGKRMLAPRLHTEDGTVTVLGDDGETVIVLPELGGVYQMAARMRGHEGLKIGVWLEPVGEALAAQLGLDPRRAILVSDLEGDGAAGAAGVERYDIVVEVEGKAVQGPDAIRTALASKEEGDTLTLVVLRAGKRHSLVLTPKMGILGSPFGNLHRWSVGDPFPSISFMEENGNDIAVIGAAAEAWGEANAAANEAVADAVADRMAEMERRLKEMEGRLASEAAQ
jgi:hypothetical protein